MGAAYRRQQRQLLGLELFVDDQSDLRERTGGAISGNVARCAPVRWSPRTGILKLDDGIGMNQQVRHWGAIGLKSERVPEIPAAPP